jgi:hypothetical protein
MLRSDVRNLLLTSDRQYSGILNSGLGDQQPQLDPPGAAVTLNGSNPSMPYCHQDIPSASSQIGDTALCGTQNRMPVTNPGLVNRAASGDNADRSAQQIMPSHNSLCDTGLAGDKLDGGDSPITPPVHLSPGRRATMKDGLPDEGLDRLQMEPPAQENRQEELLRGMSVRVIDEEPAQPNMVRAAVAIVLPDDIGLLDEVNGLLREHEVRSYTMYGTRLDDVAALSLIVIAPGNKLQSLIKKAKGQHAAHMPAGRLRTSRRRKMKLIELKLSHPADDGTSADAIPRMLRCAGINTRTMSKDSHPVPGAGDKWDGAQATSIRLTIEVHPERLSDWQRAWREIQQWAKDHKWILSEHNPLN